MKLIFRCLEILSFFLFFVFSPYILGKVHLETASVAVVVLPFHFLCLFVFTITLVTSQKESVQKVLHVVLPHPLKINASFILFFVF